MLRRCVWLVACAALVSAAGAASADGAARKRANPRLHAFYSCETLVRYAHRNARRIAPPGGGTVGPVTERGGGAGGGAGEGGGGAPVAAPAPAAGGLETPTNL